MNGSSHPDHIHLKATVHAAHANHAEVTIGPAEHEESDNRKLKVQPVTTNHGRLDLLQYTNGTHGQFRLTMQYSLHGGRG